MSRNTSAVVAVCCALMLGGATASATEFFWDDFNDGDMSDWTDLSLTVQPFDQTIHGVYGYGSRGEDPSETLEARSVKPLSNTSLSDTVRISFEVMHTGGYLGQGGTGNKTTTAWFVDGTGKGYGISASLSKDTQGGEITVVQTTDFGATVSNRGGYNISWTPDWAKHRVEAVYDRAAGRIDLYWESNPIGQVVLDPGENSTHRDFTQVISGPRQTYGGSPGYLGTDNLWIGDQANPMAPDPILTHGDANGDLAVNIGDLAILAAHMGQSPVGWHQGDSNFDWTVDMVDLTALAANYDFGSTPAGGGDIRVVVGPGVEVGTGLKMYAVHLVADTYDESVAAFEGGFSGPMNQVFIGGPTPTMERAQHLPDPDLDSHFMFYRNLGMNAEDGPGTGTFLEAGGAP